MNKPKIEFDKEYILKEVQTDQYIEMLNNKVSLANTEKSYERHRAERALFEVSASHPKWEVEVIERTTETIVYENKVNLEGN